MMRQLGIANFQANSPQVQPLPQQAAVVKQVPHTEYKLTTTAQSKHLEAIKSSNTGSGNREAFKSLKLFLEDCELYTLVNGSRGMPIYSNDNKFGYSPESVGLNYDGTVKLTPKDDYFKYHHDKSRLFQIMHSVTAKDLLYLVPTELEEKNGTAWFAAIMTHVHGNTNTDIRKAKRALEDLKISSSKTVKENISALEESIRILNIAQGVDMSADDKLYYLHENFLEDKRTSVLAIMAVSKSSKMTYLDTVNHLIEMDPPILSHHKIASLGTEPELCEKHLKGLCKRGDECKYSHKPQKPKGFPPKGKAPYTKPAQPYSKKGDEKYPRSPFSQPITTSKAHRALVGPPHGKQTTANPDGFSKVQLSLIKTLSCATPDDNWSRGDASYFEPSDLNRHSERFNMIRATRQRRKYSSKTSSALTVLVPSSRRPHQQLAIQVLKLMINVLSSLLPHTILSTLSIRTPTQQRH